MSPEQVAIAAISFIFAMSIVIVIHELGHLMMARAAGIKADKFSVGFGPSVTIWTDSRGTRWCISAIPLGGYVKFPPGGDAKGVPLQQSSPMKKIAVVLAGPASNFILSAALFATALMIQGRPSEEMIVGDVFESPPGWEAGLQAGDRIVAINGSDVRTWSDLVTPDETGSVPLWTVERGGKTIEIDGESPAASRVWSVTPGFPADRAGIAEGDIIIAVNGKDVSTTPMIRKEIAGLQGKPVLMTVWRQGDGERTVVVTPALRAIKGSDGLSETALVGISTEMGMISPKMDAIPPWQALSIGAERTVNVIDASFSGLAGLLSGTIGACNISGAISMAETSSSAAAAGPVTFLVWIAVMSTAVGFFNLLPIPALDGGHAVSFAYEAIGGRPPSDKTVAVLAFIGTSTIILLMFFGAVADLVC